MLTALAPCSLRAALLPAMVVMGSNPLKLKCYSPLSMIKDKNTNKEASNAMNG